MCICYQMCNTAYFSFLGQSGAAKMPWRERGRPSGDFTALPLRHLHTREATGAMVCYIHSGARCEMKCLTAEARFERICRQQGGRVCIFKQQGIIIISLVVPYLTINSEKISVEAYRLR